MDFQHNPRLDYSAIINRPDFTWPGRKKLAIYVALAVEHFPYGPGGGLTYSPGLKGPDTYNWAWREYGNRVGGFRLIDLFNEYQLPLSVLLNTRCYEHCTALLDQFRARGDEIVAHGTTNAIHPNNLSLEEERDYIRQATEAIKHHEGKPPAGWMSPGAHPSIHTEDLLREAGYKYTLDWPMDDQPAWLRTTAGPLLSMPYPHEVNDVPMIVLHDGTATAFADMAIDNFEEMLRQSEEQSLVYGITIHSFIIGQPYRLRQFRRVLDALTARRDRVWFATASQIADHYAGLFAPERGSSTSGTAPHA